MDAFFADLRYSWRVLRKSPVFSLITIGTLALGIGANTAIFSIVDAVIVRPLPYAEPDRIVMVWEDASYVSFPRNTPAPANYLSWKSMNRVFTDMAATRGATVNLTEGGSPEQVNGRRVTANFFSLLGVPPLLGRTFTEDEDRQGAPVVLISYGLWQRRFGGDAAIVGSDILMSGNRRTVIGVMPRTFVFRNRDVDFWAPMQFTPADAAQRGSHYLQVVARLAPGVTLQRASEDMADVAARLAREFPATNGRLGAVVVPIKEDVLGDTSLQFVVLLAAAGAVLLIACANIAGLLLSRGLSRRSELAVRAAVGATRRRLVRQMVVEALLLAVAGGTVGVALAPLAMRTLVTMVPTTVAAPATALDLRLLLFTFALAVVTGIVFSLMPALQAARASLGDALHEGGRGAIGGQRFVRDALVVAQIAIALVLLVGAGLLVRTLSHLRAIDLGFAPERLLTLRTSLPLPKYSDPMDRLAFYERVAAAVRALPGVENAGYVSTLPFLSTGNTTGYAVEGREQAETQDVLYRVGTVGYLQTLAVQLLDGRLPDERDTRDSAPVAVINETLARLHWPDASPVGSRVRFGGASTPWRTIIGVVRDVRERGYQPEMKPGAYVLFSQAPTFFQPEYLVVRSAGDPLALAPAVRRVIGEADPEQPVSTIRSMEQILDTSVVGRTGQTLLLGTFASLALLLACIGLYGVLAYAVAQRTREIGVRVALGATASEIARLVIGRGLTLTAIGLAIGVALAAAATRMLRSLLYGVGATDMATFATVIGLLLFIALGACAVPAVRAARIDPLRVLRES